MAEIGAVIDGKYKILRQIGTGGMSHVYLAVDRHLGKLWAVKEIQIHGDEQNGEVAVSSLLAEAEILKRIDHPALPRIVDIIEEPEQISLVMDYIRGESLERVLKKRGTLPEETVVDWAKQICDALLYLHSRRPPIIYRDLKPANLMLTPEGKVRIIDFGIAREYKEQSGADTTVLGTRGYASPEHYGTRQTDARSDIYTLGMTLHHLLTGVSPRTPGYLYYPVRHWNPQVSVHLEAVIDKCTALDPDDRYADCRELLYDLEHPDHEVEKRKKKPQRRRRRLVGISVLLLAIFTFGFLLRAGQNRLVQEEYDTLVSVLPSLSTEEKISSYEEAIALRPEDPTAYLCILEAMEEEGSFGREESDAFLSLFQAHREDLDATGAQRAETNYRIGRLYMSCYIEEDGEESFSARIQKAYPFFAENHENEEAEGSFDAWNLSECYYQICGFYKEYVLSPPGGEEVSREKYDRLLETLDGCVDDLLSASAYDQLLLYNGIFLLLYDQRKTMAAVGVEEEAVLKLAARVHARSVVLTVTKEQSVALQSEILTYYEDYREAIRRAWRTEGEEAEETKETEEEDDVEEAEDVKGAEGTEKAKEEEETEKAKDTEAEKGGEADGDV